jgi:hypothetical protein
VNNNNFIMKTNLGTSSTSFIPINFVVWYTIDLLSHFQYRWCSWPNKLLTV